MQYVSSYDRSQALYLAYLATVYSYISFFTDTYMEKRKLPSATSEVNNIHKQFTIRLTILEWFVLMYKVSSDLKSASDTIYIT